MISIYAHIDKVAQVSVNLREGEAGRYATLESGELSVFINSREKLLEVISLLEQAAQKWGGES